MPPAARSTDPTTHGTPLVGGSSPNVRIGKRPARRIVDVHSCPLTSGTVPHTGGVVQGGSSHVRINRLPAVRQGDTITEAGPPNTITLGDPTVVIG
jgi:uncharacterized Zn-binding protein involved in type VI secretion